MVDLSGLRPGGSNGGIKPFLLEMLRWLGAHETVPIRFTYLASASFHDELKLLQRIQDRIVTVGPEGTRPEEIPGTWRTGDYLRSPAPPGLAIEMGIDVFYAAMGSTEFACPGIPTVGLVADLLHRDWPQSLSLAEVARRESQVTEIVRISNRIQGLSKFVLDRLATHYSPEPDRTFYTHFAIPDRPAPGDSGPPAAGLPESPYFLYPANAWHHKNHGVLLQAYRSYLRKSGAEAWPLVLTGHDDEGMRSVLRLAESLGIAERVRYLGFVPEGSQRLVWRRAGALVFPSRYEGFGIPALEAMHHGLPVVASRDGSLPEVLGDAALFVDGEAPGELEEALFRIAADPVLRGELVTAGRVRIGNFSLAVEGTKLAHALKSAAAEPAVPFVRGVTANGWLSQRFIAGLPVRQGAATAEIRLRPCREPSRIRIYQDFQPLGGFPLGTENSEVLRVEIGSHARALVLETGSTKGNSAEIPIQGPVQIEEISLLSEDDPDHRTQLFRSP
jgi:glycosyltransferase involved in cell wall biosynthesis